MGPERSSRDVRFAANSRLSPKVIIRRLYPRDCGLRHQRSECGILQRVTMAVTYRWTI